jgi:hypothetical protein
MPQPTLTPISQTSAIVLPATGTYSEVLTLLPYGIYTGSAFVSGAVDQVAYTYQSLGGNILNVELQTQNVYTSYEDAVLEYSKLINIHQAKNSLSDLLGASTASFDEDGQITNALSGSNVNLKFPNVRFSLIDRMQLGTANQIGLGGTNSIYSASFDMVIAKQDYDLQAIIGAQSNYSGTIGNKRITIRDVYYKTPHAQWRFYGYYGGLNTVGNMHTYGQFADDSSFQLIPPWQNKLQAIQFEDAIWTRNSHYSYEVHNNTLRLYPIPWSFAPEKYWVRFTVEDNDSVWNEESDRTTGTTGVNNMNTLPFDNIPYESINAIGKQWIRKFALAIAKGMLGHVRGKLIDGVPIPNDKTRLNADELWSQSKEEKEKLYEELQEILEELTYDKMLERDAERMENTNKAAGKQPMFVYVG